jgi:DNA-binding transcriptional MerR regulator
MRMGEVERLTGFEAPMIRFYEKRGLFTPPKRNLRSYRLFTQAEVNELLLIKLLVGIGFKVDEIRRLKALERSREPKAVAERNELLRTRLAVVEKEIAHLEWARAELLRLLGEP